MTSTPPKPRQSKRNLHEPLGPLPTLVVIRTHAADRRAHENSGSCKLVALTTLVNTFLGSE